MGHRRRYGCADHIGEFWRHVPRRGIRRSGRRSDRTQARVDLFDAAVWGFLHRQRGRPGRPLARRRAVRHRYRPVGDDGHRQHLHYRVLSGGPARTLHGPGHDHRPDRHPRYRLGLPLCRSAWRLGMAPDFPLGWPWGCGTDLCRADSRIAPLAVDASPGRGGGSRIGRTGTPRRRFGRAPPADRGPTRRRGAPPARRLWRTATGTLPEPHDFTQYRIGPWYHRVLRVLLLGTDLALSTRRNDRKIAYLHKRHGTVQSDWRADRRGPYRAFRTALVQCRRVHLRHDLRHSVRHQCKPGHDHDPWLHDRHGPAGGNGQQLHVCVRTVSDRVAREGQRHHLRDRSNRECRRPVSDCGGVFAAWLHGGLCVHRGVLHRARRRLCAWPIDNRPGDRGRQPGADFRFPARPVHGISASSRIGTMRADVAPTSRRNVSRRPPDPVAA